MSAEQLAARSTAVGRENDATVLAVLAAAGDAGVRPGTELAERAGLPLRTTSAALGRLISRGLARRDGKRKAWATEAGRSEAGAGTPGLSLAPALDLALGCFPAEAERAFARLLLAAIPPRWHLAGGHVDGWAGFIGLGPTKTGKTSIAKLICRVYGLNQLSAIKTAQRETAGSLFARRRPDSSSQTGFRVERSPLLALPFACVDEWDKAPREIRAAAGGLLLGQLEAELEGEQFAVRPTIYVTLNTGRDGLATHLHEAHIRRSVVLDTTPLLPLLGDIDIEMRQLLEVAAIPQLSLDRLQPPVRALPPELWGELRGELRAGLTEEGWRHCDVEALSRIALGRAALTESLLEQAVLATAMDYLTCAATVDHAVPGFAGRLAPRLGAGALLPDPVAAEQQERALKDARTRRRLEHAGAGDQEREQREAVAQELREASRRLDLRRSPLKGASAGERSAAKGLAARLDGLREEASRTRSPQSLGEVRQRAAEPLSRAGELLGRLEREQGTKERLGRDLRKARALGNVPASHKARAAEIRGQLDALLREFRGAHGAELGELERRASTAIAAAAALPAEIESERERQRQAAAAAAQAEQERRREAKAAATRAKAEAVMRRDAARQQLGDVRRQIKQLEALGRRKATDTAGSPLQVLPRIMLDGQPLLAYGAAPAQPRSLIGVLEALAGPSGWWYSPRDPALRFLAQGNGCPELEDWQGPGTGQLLAAALGVLRPREAQLTALAGAGSKPRRRRAAKRKAPAPAKPAGGAKRRPKGKRARAGGQAGKAERVRCSNPNCGATYAASNLLGRRRTCSRCNAPVGPIG